MSISQIKDEEYIKFIGKNADKYLPKFKKFNVNGVDNYSATWHWPAFLFGFWWMIYRKLYMWAAIAFILSLIPYIGIVAWISFGIAGNYIYYKHVNKKLTEIKELQNSPEIQGKMILAKGGVNNIALLIALIVGVIIILGILAAVIVPRMIGNIGEVKQKAAHAQIELVGTALDSFRLDVGRYPTTAEGIESLFVRASSVDGWNGPYLKKTEIPLDPWNNPYHYKSPGNFGDYDLYSYGADNAEGGEGENRDITSWNK